MATALEQNMAYPKLIPFAELETALHASQFDKRPVLICDTSGAVESYLGYQTTALFDCKKAAVQVCVTGDLSKEDAKRQLREALRKALRGETGMSEPHCYPKPLWIRFGNSAFKMKDFCNDSDGLPPSIFREPYSIQAACEDGLITAAEKSDLILGGMSLGGWFEKNFAVWITSEFCPTEAREHLQDAIPHFDHLGLIEIKQSEVPKIPVVVEKQSNAAASAFADLPEHLRNYILEALHSGNHEAMARLTAEAAEVRKAMRARLAAEAAEVRRAEVRNHEALTRLTAEADEHEIYVC